MSVSIRLSRTGKKNSPSYRIVVLPTRSKRDGKNLEVVGHYNPSHNPPSFEYDKESLKEWVSKGAIVSPAVLKLIDGKYNYVKYEPKKARSEKEG